jgi:hypothetical protein
VIGGFPEFDCKTISVRLSEVGTIPPTQFDELPQAPVAVPFSVNTAPNECWTVLTTIREAAPADIKNFDFMGTTREVSGL